MAAPETLKEFVNMQLNLPHTFWTDAASKKLYGDDYETGSQLVSLKKLIPKERNKEQCIQFTALCHHFIGFTTILERTKI